MGEGRRTRNLFDPHCREPFKLSRSKLEDFVRCPRCFYLDRRLGVGKPPMPGFTLNSAVDLLLKREFDAYRERGEAHPLMVEAGIDAVPFAHPDLDGWRDNFKGVQYYHAPSGFLFTGAVDDLWVHSRGELLVVDYKSTAVNGTVSLNGEWKQAYKRQMEIYQWLLRQNGFRVSDTGYFVYANGCKDRDGFYERLEFDLCVLPYTGKDHWVEPALNQARECLMQDGLPEAGKDCDYCAYRCAAGNFEK